MNPGFLSGFAHMDSSSLTGLSKDVYTCLLGSLQYAAVCTCPNVSPPLRILGSAHAHPAEAHLEAMEKVLRYLQGILDLRMTLRRGLRITIFNLQALRMRIGPPTTQAHASPVLATFSHSVVALSTTRPSTRHASSCQPPRRIIILRRTPPSPTYGGDPQRTHHSNNHRLG
jgi:hypothetical protein